MKSSRFVVAIAMLLALVLPSTLAGASSSSALPTLSPGTLQSVTLAAPSVVDQQATPADAPTGAITKGTKPLLTGVSSDVYAARKAAAAHSSNAPQLGTAHQGAPVNPADPFTVGLAKSFNGQSDAANGSLNGIYLQPSDQALATGKTQVLQAVNDVVAVYSTTGVIQTGFPKAAKTFFGVPAPSPAGCQDPSWPKGPFVSDPRAFYDAAANRYVVTILELEGYYGVNPNCNKISREWIAVSQTSNAAGAYYIYTLETDSISGLPADYPTLGFDNNGIYFSFNNFDAGGNYYQFATWGGCQIAPMLSGAGLTACDFLNGPYYGYYLDTLQPVETQGDMPTGWPNTELWVTSLNLNFGDGQCRGGCSGQIVWSMSNIGTGSFAVTGMVESTYGYSLPPNADNVGSGGTYSCTYCIETLDTRISATPVYRAGFIYSAVETAVNNGSQTVPGILWMKTRVSLGDPPTVPIQGDTSVEDEGYYYYGGDGAAFFPALMPDQEGNLAMVFNFSGLGDTPSAVYSTRRATEASGYFHDGGICLVCSTVATFDSRWGDYSATSYDGTGNDIWVATQYAATNHDWATRIGKLKKYSPGTP